MARQTHKAYLIFRASDESLRVTKKTPRLAWDEIAFTIAVNVPDPWGRMAGAILVDLPENGPAVIEVKPEPVLP